TEKMVFAGFVTAWRFAAWPTRRSPDLEKATMDGVVRAPSEFSRTTGSPPSMTAMQELVVPRSIPRIFDIKLKTSPGLGAARAPIERENYNVLKIKNL